MNQKLLLEKLKAHIEKVEIKSSEEAALPTITFKPHVATCEDCGLVVENRKVNARLRNTPIPHWQHHCSACKLYRNPTTDQFEYTLKDSEQHWEEQKQEQKQERKRLKREAKKTPK